jgi:hypothetical protein
MKGKKAALEKCGFFCAKRRIQIRSDFIFKYEKNFQINCENFTWSMCSGFGSIRSVIMWDLWIRIWNTGFIHHFQKWNNLTIFFFNSCRKGSRMKVEKAALEKCWFFCAKRRIQIRSDFRFRSRFRCRIRFRSRFRIWFRIRTQESLVKIHSRWRILLKIQRLYLLMVFKIA